jgi:hypothetical protein
MQKEKLKDIYKKEPGQYQGISDGNVYRERTWFGPIPRPLALTRLNSPWSGVFDPRK